VSGVHDLTRADRRHVPVALVGENDAHGPGALDSRGHGRSAPVQGHDHVTVKLAPAANRAAGGRHPDGSFGDVQLIHDFGDKPMDRPMRAARAIGERDVGHGIGFLINDFHILN